LHGKISSSKVINFYIKHRFDILDGSVHNALFEENTVKSSWVQNKGDEDFSVQKKMTDALMYKRELESVCIRVFNERLMDFGRV
jgi:hypothetical protein